MIINSQRTFKNSKFFSLGEKVLVRGEDYVPIEKAGHIDEEEIVYIDYREYEHQMAAFPKNSKKGVLYVGAPASGKTQSLLLKMREEVVNGLSKRSFLDDFVAPEPVSIFIFTAFTRNAIESLPEIFKRMNCISKTLIYDIDNVPKEWENLFYDHDNKDWVKFLWGRARYYKNMYKYSNDFDSPLHYRMFLMPIVVGSIKSIDRINIPTEKKVYLFVDEAGLAPALPFVDLINRSSAVFGAATEGIRLEDPLLPQDLRATIADLIREKVVLPEVELEVKEKVIQPEEEEKVTAELVKKYNTVAFISDGTVYPAYENVIRRTVVTASSGSQFEVVIYKKGKSISKNPELAIVHRKIAKSKATELFVEVA